MAASIIHNPALDLDPVSFELTGASSGLLYGQANFKMGKLAFLIFRFNSSEALSTNSTIGTIPSGYRPNNNYGSYAIENDGSIKIVITPAGAVNIGGGLKTNTEYRAIIPYVIA